MLFCVHKLIIKNIIMKKEILFVLSAMFVVLAIVVFVKSDDSFPTKWSAEKSFFSFKDGNIENISGGVVRLRDRTWAKFAYEYPSMKDYAFKNRFVQEGDHVTLYMWRGDKNPLCPVYMSSGIVSWEKRISEHTMEVLVY